LQIVYDYNASIMINFGYGAANLNKKNQNQIFVILA